MVNHELNEPCARPRKKLGFRILLEFFYVQNVSELLDYFHNMYRYRLVQKKIFELVGINRTVRMISEKIESVIKRAVVSFASS